MAISGRIAAAAREGLREIRNLRRLEDATAAEQAQRQFANALQLRRLEADDRDFKFRESEATRAAEQFDRTRRDRANEVGLRQMGEDRKVLDEEQERNALIEAMNDPNTPPSLKRLLGLRKVGVNASPSAEMLLTPEERAAEDERDLRRATSIADAQARAAAKYRQRSDQYEKVETVDDKGNPIIKYMTPEEVRAAGGVPAKRPASAPDPQRAARANSARTFLDRLDALQQKINTRQGPSQRIGGVVRRGQAALGLDPDVNQYERERAATGRALAVAIMGAQNLSDADAAAWANLLPDATTDRETAQRLLASVRATLDEIGGSQPQQPMPSHGAPANPDPLGIRRPK